MSNVDIDPLFFLQVNFPPYLFEVVLFEGVDDSKSAAQVGDGVITFTLQKKEAGLWNCLISINSGKAIFYINVDFDIR